VFIELQIEKVATMWVPDDDNPEMAFLNTLRARDKDDIKLSNKTFWIGWCWGFVWASITSLIIYLKFY